MFHGKKMRKMCPRLETPQRVRKVQAGCVGSVPTPTALKTPAKFMFSDSGGKRMILLC